MCSVDCALVLGSTHDYRYVTTLPNLQKNQQLSV